MALMVPDFIPIKKNRYGHYVNRSNGEGIFKDYGKLP